MVAMKGIIENYLDESGRAMLAACFTFDNARAAEKWQTGIVLVKIMKNGPYLSAGEN